MAKRRSPRLSLDLLRGSHGCAAFEFTRAELFITQSAISREIKTLEAQIGTPLFAALTRLQLTRAGEGCTAQQTMPRAARCGCRSITESRASGSHDHHRLASLWLVPRLPRFYHNIPS